MTVRPMAHQTPIACIILAAGKGTRMKSDLPKGLHAVCGLPMVEYVGRAARGAGVRRPIIVIGHRGDLLRASLGEQHYAYTYQQEQMGTGHAALMARDLLQSHKGPVLVLPGDTPLLTSDALQAMISHHNNTKSAATLATCRVDNPFGYGRVVRDSSGNVAQVVEEKDATPDQRNIREINTSIYCFDSELLFEVLPKLGNANAQGEYYLTDAVSAIYDKGAQTETVVFEDESLLIGVNDRWQLAEAASMMRRRILRRHALNGVTIEDPNSTHIGADVDIGVDTTILGMTILEGATKIGSGCIVGPMTRVTDSEIGDECHVLMSHLNLAVMQEGSRCGPYANLRPGAIIGERAKIGNFVEVKNSTLGSNASVSHLTYIGDATVGDGVNIGAGTITCNYDGKKKHRTVIGDGTFVGSNSTLVAPVTIGNNAFVAAGSVITGDIPEDAMGIGRSKQEVKEGWAKRWRERK